MSENRSQLKTMPFKVQSRYVECLSELAYDALKHAFHVNLGKDDKHDDARVKECANFFYDKAVEDEYMDSTYPDHGHAERVPVFEKLCKAYKANTALTVSYENDCRRFVDLGWVPPAHEAVRSAVIREAADAIKDMDGPFGTLPVRSDHFPAEWWEEEEGDQEGEEGEEGDEEESEEEEVEADSADEDEDEEDGAESDGTTESQYWKAEAEEARERIKMDADNDESEEEEEEEEESEEEKDEDAENAHPNKKRKA